GRPPARPADLPERAPHAAVGKGPDGDGGADPRVLRAAPVERPSSSPPPGGRTRLAALTPPPWLAHTPYAGLWRPSAASRNFEKRAAGRPGGNPWRPPSSSRCRSRSESPG